VSVLNPNETTRSWQTAKREAAVQLYLSGVEGDSAELVGAWGLSVTWNDGHSTGIYPFESLRRWREGDGGFGPDSGLG